MSRLRCGILIGIAALAALPAFGQPDLRSVQQGRTGQASSFRAERLQGEPELQFIMRRLKLNDRQKQLVEGLMDQYRLMLEQPSEQNTALIREVLTELATAQRSGQSDRIAELRAELQALRPAAQARKQFFDSLRPALDEAQVKRLDEVEAFLRDNPVGMLRPTQILKNVDALKPTSSQLQQIARVHKEFRTQISQSRQLREKFDLTDFSIRFAASVRGKLSEAQQARFDTMLDEQLPGLSEEVREAAQAAAASSADSTD